MIELTHLLSMPHRDQTPQCPALARLVREHYTVLTEEVQAHLSTCGHCRSLVAKLKALDQKDAAAPVVLEFKVRDRLSNPVARAANTTSATAPLALAQEGEVQAEVVQLGPPVQEQRSVQLRIRTKNPAFNLQLVRYAFQTAAGVDAEVGFVWLRPARNDWFAASVTLDAVSLFQKVNGECRPVVAVGWKGAAERSDSDHAALLDAVRRDAGAVELSNAWIAWAETEATSADASDVLGLLLVNDDSQVRRLAAEALAQMAP